jgi:formylglycine-generating enzyme required for sulfatase activity
MKVFISSTSKDLKEYRQAAIDAVIKHECAILAMEHFGARAGKPVKVCADDVQKCDIFVGIYAHRYGFIPKGSQTSITQQEYELAKKLGKPRLCFIVDKSFLWLPEFIEKEKYAELEAFIKKVKDENTVTFFSDVADFQANFSPSLGKQLRDMDSGKTGEKEPPVPVKLEIPQGYKNWVKLLHSTFDLKHLGEKKDPEDIEISKAYIRIETTNPFYKGEAEKDMKKESLLKKGEKEKKKRAKDDELKEPATIDIEQLMSRISCIVLRGQAGMGKSTLVKHLTYTITGGMCRTLLKDTLPVLVFLRDLSGILKEKLKKSDDMITFESLLQTYLKKSKSGLGWPVVERYMSAGRALFLLDGLDEVTDSDNIRAELVKTIALFYHENKKNRFLITGRPHGIAGDAEKKFKEHIFDIQDLNEEKIFTFINDWFREVSSKAAGKAAEISRKMTADIRANDKVYELISTPLLLTAICILYKDGETIPEQRADLYNRVVERLLVGRFSGVKSVIEVPKAREYLMNLAFSMQQGELKEIEPVEAVEKLRKVIKQVEGESNTAYKDRLRALFAVIEPDCGLLGRSSGDKIFFSHLTFQEFLAGKHILNEDLGYKGFIKKPWWKETLLLYLGYLNIEHKAKSHGIIKSIFKEADQSAEEPEKTYLWLLACRALSEFQESNRYEEVVALARERLYTLINSYADVKVRFEAGEIVGKLGDFRIRKDNIIKVEAGEFKRGSDKKGAHDDEKPVRTIYLDSYLIGKYPVTNEEYKKFMDDGGYDNKEFWTGEGWKWKKAKKISEPLYWHDRKWNGANFPVVGVSWYEASAYAKWLSHKTGKKYRLPTEAEWEKAARGTDGRTYPWSEGIDKNKCNYNETRLRRTSPVGIFPAGKSPYGCFDMSGNVWEWCSDCYDGNYYKKSPAKNPQGPAHGEVRVLRGGDWINVAGLVRAAFRLRCVPSYRWDFAGFRLSQVKRARPAGR